MKINPTFKANRWNPGACEYEANEVIRLAAHNAGGEPEAVDTDLHGLGLDVELPYFQSSTETADSGKRK